MLSKFINKFAAFSGVMLAAGSAMAEDKVGILRTDAGGWIVIGFAIGVGLAAFAGALGQSRIAAAALEGIARNPTAADKLQTPMILGLAFVESLVLFVWVLMVMILFTA